MEKLQLEFSGKRSTKEESLGNVIRVNTSNGNCKLSESAANAMGISVGQNINVSIHGGVGYFAQEDRGFKLGKGYTTTTQTIASSFKSLFAEEANNDGVIFAEIDVENPLEASTKTEEGEEVNITVYPLSFHSSKPQKQRKTKSGNTNPEQAASEDMVGEEMEEMEEMV